MDTINNQRNPILPLNIHIPDGEAHVMPDGQLYIYGSLDNRSDVFCSESYQVVSTPDMKNWTVYGEALNGNDIPWFNNPNSPKCQGIDWSKPTPFIKKMLGNADNQEEKKKFESSGLENKPALLFAPDCIYKDGKYYLYFCMSDDSEGVAVSDSPEGPFLNPKQLPCGGIDPAVFIDDNGKAYYFWGQLFSHGVELNSDMMSFDPEKIVHNLVTEEEHHFHEGASMRKIGDLYYLVYSNIERGKPTSLGYSTSKTPLGPFFYQGIIINNERCDPASWNNHGSIEKFNDQWYIFYHRCSRGVQQYRRLCIEPIQINDDGTINEVKMTSQGVGDPFMPGEKIMAYQACELNGDLFIDADENFGEKLVNITSGDSCIFRYVESKKNYKKIIIDGKGSGEIKVLLNNVVVGEISITDSKQQNKKIEFLNGKYELSLEFYGCTNLELYSIILE